MSVNCLLRDNRCRFISYRYSVLPRNKTGGTRVDLFAKLVNAYLVRFSIRATFVGRSYTRQFHPESTQIICICTYNSILTIDYIVNIFYQYDIYY